MTSWGQSSLPPSQPRSGLGQTQLIQSLQNWKILQKSNNQIFDVFLSIPVAEPNKAQMRFKSQNTIITVSVSEHSVSLTRVCVSKYKILDTRRFRELLGRPPPGPGQLSTWPQLSQAAAAAPPATEHRGNKELQEEACGPGIMSMVPTPHQAKTEAKTRVIKMLGAAGRERLERGTSHPVHLGWDDDGHATVQVIPAPRWQCWCVGVITRPGPRLSAWSLSPHPQHVATIQTSCVHQSKLNMLG